jgi:hypothetical protein
MAISKMIPESKLKDKLRNYLWRNPVQKPVLPEDAREYLYSIFKNDVKNLEQLIQRPTPWKNFN